MKLTGTMLASAIYAELDRDGWGDIDPWWFKEAAKLDPDSDHYKDAKALLAVCDRVVANLKGTKP